MTCAATRARSEPKERREARLLSVIGFAHAEHVAIRATRGVADNDHPVAKHAEADDPRLAVVLALVLNLEVRTIEHQLGVFEVQSPARKRGTALLRIVRDGHPVSVATSTRRRKSTANAVNGERQTRDATRAFFAAERPEVVFLAAAKVGDIVANATYPAEFIRDNLAIQTNVAEFRRWLTAFDSAAWDFTTDDRREAPPRTDAATRS